MIYKIIAFMILVGFYGCYCLKMLMQSKKGIKTNQLGKGKNGIVKWIEIGVSIATFSCLATEIAAILLGSSILPVPLQIAGACIGVIGVVVFIVSVVTMHDSWRAGIPCQKETKLITDGIYSISRNPAFLGFDLVYIGILLMFFIYWLFAVTIVTVIMLHLQIVNVEEEFLATEFGEEYLKYKKRVCRYLGRR